MYLKNPLNIFYCWDLSLGVPTKHYFSNPYLFSGLYDFYVGPQKEAALFSLEFHRKGFKRVWIGEPRASVSLTRAHCNSSPWKNSEVPQFAQGASLMRAVQRYLAEKERLKVACARLQVANLYPTTGFIKSVKFRYLSFSPVLTYLRSTIEGTSHLITDAASTCKTWDACENDRTNPNHHSRLWSRRQVVWFHQLFHAPFRGRDMILIWNSGFAIWPPLWVPCAI